MHKSCNTAKAHHAKAHHTSRVMRSSALKQTAGHDTSQTSNAWFSGSGLGHARKSLPSHNCFRLAQPDAAP